MSERDDAIERAVQLIARCDTVTLVRVADELEESLDLAACAGSPSPAVDDRTARAVDALRQSYE